MPMVAASYAVGLRLLGLLSLVSLLPLTAGAELPRRDFVVELRQVAENRDGPDEPAAYSVATTPVDQGLALQQVRVQNGEKAQLRITQSMPMQWLQSVSANHHGAAVGYALTTVEAGQTLVLTPRWAGGSRPVSVAVDLQTAAVDERTGAELPATARRHVLTTVTTPLRQWVTIATTGTSSTPGNTYRSAGVADAKRLIQIRVSPP